MAKEIICATCGTRGYTKRYMPGSILIEIVLWLCFIIPGLIYSLWRHAASKRVCRQCSSQEVVPIATPRGQALIRQFTTPAAPAPMPTRAAPRTPPVPRIIPPPNQV